MVGAMSDIGNLRVVNEDYLDYYICDSYQLYIIADGMGGHNAGDIASKICVRMIKEYIINEYFDGIDLELLLKNAVQFANREIYFKSLENKKYKGMGTTLTLSLVRGNKIYIVNVGDSCFFSIDGREITKITKDHSFVQQLIDNGLLSQDEAKDYPNRNIITRSIGINVSVEIDMFIINNDKNFYLLCTDGLINEMNQDEIVPYIENNKNDLYKACNDLITLAKERGGRDNVSLIIFGGTSNDR
ncbi:Stp1/IreP family PP2C-type Ser/Thr phosphatase [Candidatus Arthromitus sp. SFB-rat-Yit]|uniref:Stp1/IreP family PP2C-type Ser/Thr phosphatase n=1 Tax=Candidatus Arthromitus sp. SFB-rat-Yit TaxID=1041504 RepID=UPI000227A651|nr:Stp1/IreP family PP2C-type Ser/Thr phosphatase [Candidatus Arthromitus sp. SFB-rat-Yit]BAK81064.1 protein serine/threonine phosphatase [Candidatus Arthromitus sp. SFB-rat-Yit]